MKTAQTLLVDRLSRSLLSKVNELTGQANVELSGKWLDEQLPNDLGILDGIKHAIRTLVLLRHHDAHSYKGAAENLALAVTMLKRVQARLAIKHLRLRREANLAAKDL